MYVLLLNSTTLVAFQSLDVSRRYRYIFEGKSARVHVHRIHARSTWVHAGQTQRAQTLHGLTTAQNKSAVL